MMTRFFCGIFGHRLFSNTTNVAGQSTCSWCGYKEHGVKWPKTNTQSLNTKKKV